MSGQTSVNPAGQPFGFAGLPADNGKHDSISGVNVDSVSLPFGCAVMQDPNSEQGMLACTSALAGGSDATNAVKGILAQSMEHVQGTFGDLDSTGLIAQAAGDVGQKGRWWVVLDGNLTIKPFFDRPSIRYSANGGNTQVGAFTNSRADDSSHTADYTRCGRFVSTAQLSADGTTYIAKVDMDFTISPAAEGSGD